MGTTKAVVRLSSSSSEEVNNLSSSFFAEVNNLGKQSPIGAIEFYPSTELCCKLISSITYLGLDKYDC